MVGRKISAPDNSDFWKWLSDFFRKRNCLFQLWSWHYGWSKDKELSWCQIFFNFRPRINFQISIYDHPFIKSIQSSSHRQNRIRNPGFWVSGSGIEQKDFFHEWKILVLGQYNVVFHHEISRLGVDISAKFYFWEIILQSYLRKICEFCEICGKENFVLFLPQISQNSQILRRFFSRNKSLIILVFQIEESPENLMSQK